MWNTFAYPSSYSDRVRKCEGILYPTNILYIDSYIDLHGHDSVYEATDSDIFAEIEVTAAMDSFLQYCDGRNPTQNKCLDGSIKDTKIFTKEIVGGKSITAYSYSELIANYLQYAINNEITFDVYNIIAPPLGPQNNFLMYTDALMVNKRLPLSVENQQDMNTFINFYTNLSTRLSISFGEDLPDPHPLSKPDKTSIPYQKWHLILFMHS